MIPKDNFLVVALYNNLCTKYFVLTREKYHASLYVSKKKEKKKQCPGNGIFNIVCSKTDAHIYKFKNEKENEI